MRSEIFRMERVTCQKNGIQQLRDCDLHIFSGEILGLIPLNSHGLPALIDVMTKNLPLQYGFVFLKEKIINHWRRPRPRNNPVGLIQSVSHLVEGMTLTDNVFVLRNGFRAWYIQSRLLRTQLAPFFWKIGVEVPLDIYPEDLTAFQRVVVELIRAIVAGHRLIVLQDISTILNEKELEKIHGVLRQCTKEGFSFLYISSHPEDLTKIADRVAVFGNGRVLKTAEGRASLQDILDNAARGDVLLKENLSGTAGTVPLFRAEGLRLDGTETISFSVYPGECVILQDVNNQLTGQIVQMLLGEWGGDSGQLWLREDPLDAVPNRDIAVIQELPTQTMLFPRLSYFDNLFMTSDHHLPGLWRSRRMQHRLTREQSLRTNAELFDQPVESLSELEKYNLIYNRILLQKPAVVFCVHPFKATDMQLRNHIHQWISQLLKKQIAVVFLTTNATDACGIADRVVYVGSAASI